MSNQADKIKSNNFMYIGQIKSNLLDLFRLVRLGRFGLKARFSLAWTVWKIGLMPSPPYWKFPNFLMLALLNPLFS